MNELLNFKWNESENFKIISKNYNELNNDLKNVINFSKEYVKILICFKQQASDLYTSYLFDYSKNKKSFCSNIIKSFSKLIYAQIESFKTLIEGLTLRNVVNINDISAIKKIEERAKVICLRICIYLLHLVFHFFTSVMFFFHFIHS